MTDGNHNHRFWKWVTGVLSVLLLTAITGYIRSEIKRDQFEKAVMELLVGFGVKQDLMGKRVDKNAQWIVDWSAVLKVPERDQRQDSHIEELTRRVTALEGQ